MRVRLFLVAAVAAIAAFAVSLSWVTGAAGPKSATTLKAADQAQSQDDGWQREMLYIARDNRVRVLPPGPESGPAAPLPLNVNQVPQPETPASAIDVLAIGDSVTMGYGVFDLPMRWPDMLQRVLDDKYGQGVFHVRTLAIDGASVFEEAHWLVEGDFDFDVLVLGYVDNDPIPSPRHNMLDGKEIPILMREQVCGPGSSASCDESARGLPDNEDIIANPNVYPLWDYFEKAVDSIALSVGDRPWLVFDTGFPEKLPQEYLDVYYNAGAQPIPRPATDKVATRDDIPALEFRTIPPDGHPGPVVTHAYALDIASALENTLDPGDIEAAQQAATRTEPHNTQAPLVDNYLPTSLTVNTDPTKASVTSSGQGPDWARENEAEQQAPCMQLGHPYAQVMVNYRIEPSGTLRVTLANSVGPLAVHAAGYDESFVRWYRPLGLLEPGSYLDLAWQDGLAGFLFADESVDCADPSKVKLGVWDLTIERVR